MSRHNSAHWPEIVFERLRERLGLIWQMEARLKGAEVQAGVVLGGRPILSVVKGSRMVLGAGAVIRSGRRNNPLGCFQPCVLRTLATEAELVLERNVGMSATTVCAGRSIHIGEDTLIGAGALILDNDLHRLDTSGIWKADVTSNARPIRIGRSVFVGARAIILKGVSIGDGAVVGAGAVVTHDVPAGHTAVGSPAMTRPQRNIPGAD